MNFAEALQQIELPLRFSHFPSASDTRYVLICLHGRGDSMHGLMWLRQHLQIRHTDFVFLNAPDPWPTPLGDGFSWYPAMPHHHEGIVRSADLLGDFLRQLQALGIPSESIALLGFSQGCVMSLATALPYPKPLAGVIGISGFVHRPEELLQSVSRANRSLQVLMTHGWQDEVLDYEKTCQQAQILEQGLPRLEFQSYSKGHHIAPAEIPVIENFLHQIFE